MSEEGSASQGGSNVYGMPAFGNRQVAIDEVHARPYLLIEHPRALVQLAFMNEGNPAKDKVTLAEISSRMGVSLPDQNTPHHGLTWDQGDLHCEKHTEFSTYLWSAPLDPDTGKLAGEDPFRHGFTPPGQVVCGIRLDVVAWTEETAKYIDRFDPISRCHSLVEDGMADIVTDFRQDADGLTRILILDRGLTPIRLGALAQRLLEIETYRTLALLSIPLTQKLGPHLRDIEKRLAAITDEMRQSARRHSEELLSRLTDLSAELEAETASSLYRFGASRAYYEIVEERLAALGETFVPGCYRWRSFLHRRIAPAMRTCRTIEERQANLSDKLARATSLLRSWIDVQLERQNSDLLASMNNRAKLQLRLQQTVEGLSVAAISYYVIGLLAYLIKGLPGLHDVVAPELVISGFVPVVLVAIWWTVRRIRHSHNDHGLPTPKDRI
ncbi:MAG: DUF3422 family protein [Agrobacterium sp.]|nr:DUF3422 family protein [Agrobacterium sp.]